MKQSVFLCLSFVAFLLEKEEQFFDGRGLRVIGIEPVNLLGFVL